MDFKGDIHTNGAPKSGQENLLKKDNVATPEARSFEIKVGDPVDKTDGKKEDPSFISGLSVGQTWRQCQGSLGENGFGQICNTDMFGFTQQGMNTSANMNVGLAPFQSTEPPTMAESQKTSILHANEPPKPFLAPSNPSDTSTHILDKPAEVCSWTGQAMLTHSPNKAEQSPSERLGYQGVPHKDATSDEGSDEAVQQKKKKCETSEEAYGLLESLRTPEKTLSKTSNQEDCSPPGNGESWKSEIREWGGGRIQAKKSKSRKKLPEEWASLPNTGSPSLPPDPNTTVDIDMDMFIPDMYEGKDPPTTFVQQEGSLPSFTAALQSAIPATLSQENTILLSNSPDLSQSNQVLTSNLTSGLETTAHAISSPHADTKTFQKNSSSPSDPSSIVVSQNPADPASLTSQTNHQEPLQAKSHQGKEDTIAKEKIEKIDASPKTDILNTLVKADKPENTEKTDNKKVDNMGKIQEAEKQDSKTEKNGKPEKANNVEETKKEVMEEKKNGGEKVDKTVKNEKNVKAAKETSKPTAANGNKDLISPDKVKSNKQNSAKPSSHSTGENSRTPSSSSANKSGPVAKKTSPTGTKKPPGITSTHEAKTSENSTPAQRKPPVPKFNGASKGSSGTKTSSSSVKTTLKKTPTNAASTPTTPASDGTPAPRASRITKPPVPKQVPLPKKPPVPRAPRNARIPNTPLPDLKNVSSKVGSTDNMKYQPGGGKVMIVHKKLDFSHITSRCGSKDNIKHIPGGGNVQILNKKVDLSKVTSKCGSKDNINHKPGGGNAKTESQKSKPKSKTGSMNNVGQEPGDDHAEGVGDQQKSEGSPPAPANPPIQTSGGTKEKELKESSPVPPPAPSEGQGIWNSQSQDKPIPATN
ncbi:microtubule-associated protein tau isoform X1 [Pangasianodon hypophthalmus]|uniref:microtubule-associated protein tau isoform X1 n=1 Tax=Pangasianodon hypophthalmus TaxID=310915 RepID=UPI000EFE25C8|nr:microtubule-associated protein tau isoform X1 [Pangasianodon hypophthalmus]